MLISVNGHLIQKLKSKFYWYNAFHSIQEGEKISYDKYAITELGDSYSAGRLYDKIGDTAEGTVLYVLPRGVLCYVNEKDVREEHV